MLFHLDKFKGAVPRVHPRLLQDSYAQLARNTRLEDGTIGPVKLPRLENTLGVPALSFIKYGSTWLGWPGFVDAVPAPVAGDRIYYTGDAAPKMRDGATIYALALPAPAAAPTVTALSAVNPATAETIYYAYTFVTSFGEESPPSPLSAASTWSAGVVMRLSAFSAPPAARAVTHRRIYRSETSASGVTELFFVAEILLAVTPYDHDLVAAPLVEPIPSTDYDTPPATLAGLTSLPSGMMAAFDGKEVLFCEPYQPHAWPGKYALTVDYPIVGLAAFGSVLAILTTGTPYIVQGTHPESMAMEKMDKSLPCLSRRGIVDIGYACYFPSSEGLAVISATDSNIVTRNLFTRDQWRNMSPESIVADSYNGRYVFTHNYSSFDGFDAGTFASAPVDSLDGGAFSAPAGPIVAYDFGSFGSSFGLRRMGSIDLVGDMPFFLEADVMLPEAMFTDQDTGTLYALVGGTEIMAWDDPASPRSTQTWRSKRLVLPYATNFGAALVQTNTEISPGDVMNMRVIADGAVVATIMQSNIIARLPSGFLAKEWEVEIESNMDVTSIAIAHTMEELEGVL